MNLLIDIGNTNIKLGLANSESTLFTWRIATDNRKTADEFGMILLDLLESKGYEFSDIKGVIMSSVVPSMNYTMEHMCTYYIGIKPITVDAYINMTVNFDLVNKEEVGADRIICSEAAYTIYGGPCIIVDFGTATTFNVLDENGVFLGGAIAPGLKLAAEALVNTAAKLPRVELAVPEFSIARTTITNMQSGIVIGFKGLVEGVINAMKSELARPVKVIATGGLSELVTSQKHNPIDIVDRALSIKGLALLYKLNQRKEG
ncbi:MAG: type III pantothenate kinase [Christensenellales bacterium]|jgi:type III pantothenate kinase